MIRFLAKSKYPCPSLGLRGVFRLGQSELDLTGTDTRTWTIQMRTLELGKYILSIRMINYGKMHIIRTQFIIYHHQILNQKSKSQRDRETNIIHIQNIPILFKLHQHTFYVQNPQDY